MKALLRHRHKSIAIAAVFMSFGFSPNPLSSRTIFGCFQQISVVRNLNDGNIIPIEFSRCNSAQEWVVFKPYVYSASSPNFEFDPCPTEDIYFCCAYLTEIFPTDPDWAAAPYAFINGVWTAQKYKVDFWDIECKEEITR